MRVSPLSQRRFTHGAWSRFLMCLLVAMVCTIVVTCRLHQRIWIDASAAKKKSQLIKSHSGAAEAALGTPRPKHEKGQDIPVLAHVVSPFLGSNLEQDIALTSLLRAKNATTRAHVELYCSVFPEDARAVPNGFGVLPFLNRSTVSEYPQMNFTKKLPFIDDLLSSLYNTAVDADFLIYSNIDIGIQEHFYDSVIDFIGQQGHDAFTITRRTIQGQVNGVRITSENVKLAYQQKGEKHAGFDMFVFKRDLFATATRLENVYIGYPPVGNALKIALKESAKSWKDFLDEQLTFHIGNEMSWKGPAESRFHRLNFQNSEKALGKQIIL